MFVPLSVREDTEEGAALTGHLSPITFVSERERRTHQLPSKKNTALREREVEMSYPGPRAGPDDGALLCRCVLFWTEDDGGDRSYPAFPNP
jgi:hypothetical protein